MRMRGYSPKEFVDILISYGWRLSHKKSTHYSYTYAGHSCHALACAEKKNNN